MSLRVYAKEPDILSSGWLETEGDEVGKKSSFL
jgi:hypothetical protein